MGSRLPKRRRPQGTTPQSTTASPADSVRRTEEIATILANGYFRLVAKMRRLDNAADYSDHISACPASNCLDIAAPRSDDCKAARSAGDSTVPQPQANRLSPQREEIQC